MMRAVTWNVAVLVVLVSGVVLGDDYNNMKRPNVVIMVADDMGIGDIGCYGNHTIKTPNIDRLCVEGMKLTHHLAAAAMCTPSRAALLTARYPARYGLEADEGTPAVIVHVASRVGLPLSEITLAKALSAANYTTAAVGKWHLGQGCKLGGKGCLGPRDHGFQSFYGIPFSLIQEFSSPHSFWMFPLDGSDPFYQMLLTVWVVVLAWAWWWGWSIRKLINSLTLLAIPSLICWFLHTHYRFHTKAWWQMSPWMNRQMNGVMMDEDRVTEQPLVLEGLSQRLVERSVKFIDQHADDHNPFFLYHSFAHVHTPMFTDKGKSGRSVHGRYGDNVEEMDDGVGEILRALDRHDLASSTIVYFLSDHGGHLEALGTDGQREGGYNGKFKGGKSQGASEGAIRVPGIYRWTEHIPPGRTLNYPTSSMDTLPTILDLVGLPSLDALFPHLPYRELDGKSFGDQLRGSNNTLPSRTFLHHCGREIHAVRLVYETLVYKMHLVGYKWGEGSTQCGWGYEAGCSCYDVHQYEHLPKLYELSADPYEDHPIDQDSMRYMEVTGLLKQGLAEWKAQVTYPPSMLSNKFDTMHTLWIQPFA